LRPLQVRELIFDEEPTPIYDEAFWEIFRLGFFH
jgi:hypothetical protein